MKYFRQLLNANSPEEWMIALSIALAVYFILFFLRPIVIKRIRQWSRKTSSYWDEAFAAMIAAINGFTLFAVSLYAGSRWLELPPRLEIFFDKTVILIVMLQLGLSGARGIRTWVTKKSEHGLAEGKGDEATHLGIVGFLLSVILWSVLVLVTLNNLGFNITALVASLGIGGVAVALAVQNILGDLFASLSIAIDKPFLVGDFIVVDDLMGTVKHVGLKTTRLQSLSGEELIFSNNDLLKSRIRNYKRMWERRIVFGFGIRYGTPVDKIEKLSSEVKAIVEAQKLARFDRAHFKGFGSSSLDFEVVYYVQDPDYSKYMDSQQAINLAMMRRFAELGVEFALPVQTLHVASFPGSREEREKQ